MLNWGNRRGWDGRKSVNRENQTKYNRESNNLFSLAIVVKSTKLLPAGRFRGMLLATVPQTSYVYRSGSDLVRTNQLDNSRR